jgi:hypothetical protein
MVKQSFVKSPQIGNWQIFGHIRLSQIRKFVRCASPQIANPQVLWLIKPANFNKIWYSNTLSQTSPKSCLFKRLHNVQILIIVLHAIFVRRKSQYNFRTCGSIKSANHKNIGSAKYHCHTCRRSKNLTNYFIPQICGFAEIICGPPTHPLE